MGADAYQGPCLPVQVPIGPDDSLSGYFYKVAEEYSYGSLWPLLNPLDFWPSVRHCLDRLVEVAALLKIPFDELKRRAYWQIPGGNLRSFLGHHIREKYLCLSECKVCPECLREGRTHEALFDLIFITACDRHRCRLMSECPQCHRRLSWARAEFHRCTICGFDLKTAKAVPAGATALALAASFRRAVHDNDPFHETESIIRPDWPRDVEALDFRALCGIVGLILANSPRTAAIAKKRRARVQELHGTINVAIDEFFCDWPKGALALFDHVRQERVARAPVGAPTHSRRYSVGLSSLSREFGGEPPKLILDALSLHWAQSTYSPRHQSKLDNARLISVKEAARRLNVSVWKIERLGTSGLLPLEQLNAAPRIRRVVVATELPDLQRSSQETISRWCATLEYSLTDRILDHLQEVGVVKRVQPLTLNRSDSACYDRTDIDAMFARLAERAIVVPIPEVAIVSEAERVLPGFSSGTYRSLAKCTKHQETIVSALNGCVTVYRLANAPSHNLDAYFIRTSEARAVQHWALANTHGLSLTQAAKVLGLLRKYLSYMCTAGIFVPTGAKASGVPKMGRKGSGHRFSKEDIFRFQRQFVRATEIALHNGIVGGRVSGTLASRASSLIPSHALGKRQLVIYRRRDVAPALAAVGWEMPPVNIAIQNGLIAKRVQKTRRPRREPGDPFSVVNWHEKRPRPFPGE